MKKTKILICGVSGFIGRNIFEHYNALYDYQVYGTYFRNKPGLSELFISECDLRCKEEALNITRDMDIIINCSAMTDGIGVFSDKNKMAEYTTDNRTINDNLIEAAYANNAKHFIFLSCTVMYPSSSIPLREYEYDLKRIHPKYYLPARMKIDGENYCKKFGDLGKTKYTAIRHSNIYGPYDKFDLIRGHVLAATIEKVMTNDYNITVWGNGKESRDFLYISDLIGFINQAVEQQKTNFELFNVGYGKTCSINELVQKIIYSSGKKLQIIHDLEKPTIETHMNIDVQKARQILDWKAQIGLSEGLVMTLDWYHNQPR